MLLNQNLSANVKCSELFFFSNSLKFGDFFPQKRKFIAEIYFTHKKRLLLSPIRVSLPVLSMWPLQKYFSHPSLVIYFFCNPTPKTETGNGDMWEPLIAHHLEQSLCLANQKHGAGVRSYLLHSSLAQSHSFAEHICRSKTIFPELNRHVLTFLHLIRSTSGDALRQANMFWLFVIWYQAPVGMLLGRQAL
jgi:hypothetical protein